MSNTKPIVICGPSGAGKGTLIAKVMEKHPKRFGFAVSHTTRLPRVGEENGVHYHFVEKDNVIQVSEDEQLALNFAKWLQEASFSA